MQRYIVLSTDEKPSASTLGLYAGAELIESDTLKEYFFNGEEWVSKEGKNRTMKWLNQEVPAGGYWTKVIFCKEFDLATSFICSDGNLQVTLRVTKPDGSEHSWDALSNINAASPRASAQAKINGLDYVSMVVVNNGEVAITADMFVYLGKD